MTKLLLFTICILLASPAPADSFRCGRSLVKTGDTSNSLIRKCGKPVSKYTSKENINDRGRRVHTNVSNWVYARKRGKEMIVSVYSGAVVKIQTG